MFAKFFADLCVARGSVGPLETIKSTVRAEYDGSRLSFDRCVRSIERQLSTRRPDLASAAGFLMFDRTVDLKEWGGLGGYYTEKGEQARFCYLARDAARDGKMALCAIEARYLEGEIRSAEYVGD